VSNVIAGNRTFAARDYFDDHGPAQEALRDERRRRGHALCACVHPHRRLVIREIRGTCYLALWPNDGHFHDATCPFYRSDESQTEGKGSRSEAIRLNAEGQWDLAIDLALQASEAAPLDPTVRGPNDGAVAHPQRARLTLEQLLHWIWRSASLNRWGPAWKRDWWRVERELTSATATAVVHGESLSQLLYIPPAFRRDREDTIRAGWDSFAARLRTSAAGGVSGGLVIGHVKEVTRSQFGYRISLRHLAPKVYADSALYAALAKQAPLALSMVSLQEQMKCAVIALLEVTMSAKGYLHARRGVLILTGERFIPADNLHELVLVNELTTQDRRFERPEPGDGLGDFLLLDTTPPTALEVFSLETPDYRALMQQREAALRGRGLDLWCWRVSSSRECPPLPPRH